MPNPASVVVHVRAATARISWLHEGVPEVIYRGVLTLETFKQLRYEVLQATRGARSLILRMESAVCAMDRSVSLNTSGYPTDTPPAAVVCTAEDYPLWSEYGGALAQGGVMRAVFLPEHLELARLWARRQALVRL
jgi:hypothetical protein